MSFIRLFCGGFVTPDSIDENTLAVFSSYCSRSC